jgi:2,4-dienoyl-CoA reductase-like NADH-dependent reductase (Old Yellow Enzyme family)
MKYEHLFTPIKVGKISFPNRIMRTSMVSGLATEDGHVTDDLRNRYYREAQGGVGSIVVEASVVLPSRSSFNLRISDDSFVGDLRGLVERIRKANAEAKVGVQLVHFLKIARSGWRQKVMDFKKEDLPVIVEQHVLGAKRAVAAGFDFVELHMAHAYTLSSFLSLNNERSDEYGGSALKNRMRLPLEVYRAVRDALGADYPIGVRINGEDFTIKGTTLLQSTKIARKLAESGVDYISVSAGSRFEDAPTPPPNTPPDPMAGYAGHRMSPWWWWPDGTHVYLSEAIRATLQEAGLQVPVIIAGKIRTPGHAEKILSGGKADMIGLCRALLCDPDWPRKAKEGRETDIIQCTACNWCLESDSRMEKVSCSRWPEGSMVAPTPWEKRNARASKLSRESEGESA